MLSNIFSWLQKALSGELIKDKGGVIPTVPHDLAGGPTVPAIVLHQTAGFKVGDLAAKYETSNRGPGYVSSGNKWGDPGGISYGTYQIETNKGTMKDYLNRTDDMFTKELKKYKINSTEFINAWKKLAMDFPDMFQESQFEFLASKPGGYNDALAYAAKLGWDVKSFAMCSAIFSTSNQSGGWKTGIFNKAGIKATDTPLIQVNKLYDARARYFKSLTSLTNEIKRSIMQQRCGNNLDLTVYKKPNERLDCIKLL